MCIRDRPTPAAQPITLQNARRSPHPRFQPMTRRNRRRGTACGASGLSQAPTDVSQEPKVVTAPDWIAFHGAAQIAQLRRTRTVHGRTGKKTTTEVVYLCLLYTSPSPRAGLLS